jgi:energy-coupling factor transporter ATP-binding protein EcfA2
MNIDIKPSERIMIMGKTGSGKTEWERFMLRRIALHMPVVIIDPKIFWLGENPIWASGKSPGTVDHPRLVKWFNPKYWVQCIQPDEYDDKFERFLKALLKQKNVYTCFDETDGLCTATQVPTGIRKVWKQGRVLKVGASAGSQTYSGIPRIFKSQAEKFVLFRVGDEDIEDAAHLLHCLPEEVANLGDFEWMYYDNTSMNNGIWMPPIDIEAEKKIIELQNRSKRYAA